jgi:long-subunit fatty acid transport protein
VSSQGLFAQEPADALRYSWYTSSGTARQQAVGGAMASLGGDISATFVNPAGLAFYKTGDFVLTPGYNFLNNKATYYGRTEKDTKNGFSFGTSGVVIGGGTNNKKNGIRSAALSLAINQTANFSNNLLYRGANNQNSYSQKFLDEIKNNNDKDANNVAQGYPFGTSLAFNTYWIDTIAGGTSGNYQFQTRAPVATGLLQENNVVNSGGITELALAGAANFNDKLLVGGTFGLPFLHYKKEATFTEADATSNVNNKFDFASISENLTTDGVGFNIKAGIIYKPVEYIRLGFAIHSPTFYSLTDKYNASVTTNTEGYKGMLTQSSGVLTNGQDGQFKYTLVTPYHLIASASYVLREIEDVRKQKGFLTADIEFVNYKASSFKTDPQGDNSQSTKDYLKSLNNAIKNAYKPALNFKVGGELKFTTIMARLGAAYYGNPYQNLNGAKGNRFQLSGGLGYRNKGMFIDIAYIYTMGKDVHFPYRLQTAAFSGASIKATGGNAILTVGFKI